MLKLFKRDESFGAMLEDVLYFKAEGHYTNVFFTRDSKMLLPYGLSQLDNEIWKLDNGTCFVKVGRSHIVNLKKVVYACITKESFTLMDQNGNFTNIVVSRAAIKQLIKALKDGKASKEEKSDSDNNDNGPKRKESKSAMLMAKLTALSVGEPKFSLFISSTAAAAISPTIVGRKPLKMSFTIFESLWLMR